MSEVKKANDDIGDRSKAREGILASPCNYEATYTDLTLRPVSNESEGSEGVTPPPTKIKNRFRKLVRMMLTHSLWLREATVRSQKDRAVEKYRTESGEKLTFNVNAFRAHVHCGRLSVQAIRILAKPAGTRTDSEVKQVQKIIYRLKCFDRYPIHIKQELSQVIYYDKFENGRLIIKQGHAGISFYFIISGSVKVERAEYDPFTQEHYVQKVGELHAGDCFGELALLHNTKRTASIVCCGTSEFLRIDKDDFDEVLRNSHEREWEIRINLLSSHPVFQGWSTRDLKIANGHSKMKTYPPHSVIVSEKKRRDDRVFFIATGRCAVVRRLDLVRKNLPDQKYRYLLPPLQESKRTDGDVLPQTSSHELTNDRKMTIKWEDTGGVVKKNPLMETRYFNLCELKAGDFFNVGENLDSLYVLTLGRVEVVQVGTLAFSRHSDRLRSLEKMKEIYLEKIPSYEATYDSFIEDRRWKQYKKNLVKEATSFKNNVPSVDAKHVPGIVRKDEIYYYDDTTIV